MKPYALSRIEPLMLVDGDTADHYVLTLRDLPNEDKPREKLLRLGPGGLSTPELVSVLFGTGTKKEDVKLMSERILKEYGDSTLTTLRDPKRAAKDLDIPLVKAMQLVVVGELGRRFFGRKDGALKVVRTADEAFVLLADMTGLTREHLRGLYLNSQYQVIHDEIISIGTIDANLVHPREVFRPAIEYSASAVILAHNHPSGTLEASSADREITKQLVQAGQLLGIRLLDHLIIGRDGFIRVPADY